MLSVYFPLFDREVITRIARYLAGPGWTRDLEVLTRCVSREYLLRLGRGSFKFKDSLIFRSGQTSLYTLRRLRERIQYVDEASGSRRAAGGQGLEKGPEAQKLDLMDSWIEEVIRLRLSPIPHPHPVRPEPPTPYLVTFMNMLDRTGYWRGYKWLLFRLTGWQGDRLPWCVRDHPLGRTKPPEMVLRWVKTHAAKVRAKP